MGSNPTLGTMENVYKKNDKLVIEIPLIGERHNPYDEDHKVEMDNIIGVIAGDEFGFAYQIDMAYKGKADQYTDFFYFVSKETIPSIQVRSVSSSPI